VSLEEQQMMKHRLGNAAFRNGLAGLLAGCTGIAMCAPAFADNPLGLYIGAGVGESHVRNDLNPFANVSGFVKNHTGWKALIGVRPISFLGAEVEYADFGHPGATTGPLFPGLVYHEDVSQKAGSVFGLVYWPLPVPIFDLYGKAGVSRLQTRVDASVACAAPAATCVVNVPTYHQESTDSRFAYGAGAQAKFLNLAVRAEYERISAPQGSPDLYSLIVTWTF
jgi:opacity protein-like surface antigen